jgi:hypothetical protein
MGAGAAEEHERLWMIAASPAIWAAHFLLSYGTAALWCAKVAGRGGSLSWARAAILAYSVVALVLIALVGWRGWRRHRLGSAELPHDDDSPEDRHRFLGFASLLLSGLSALAILYELAAVAFTRSCR